MARSIVGVVLLMVLFTASALPSLTEAREIAYEDSTGWKASYGGKISKTHERVQKLKLAASAGYDQFRIVAMCATDDEHDYAEIRIRPNGNDIYWTHKTKVLLYMYDGTVLESEDALFTGDRYQMEVWRIDRDHPTQKIDDSLLERTEGYVVYVTFPVGIQGIERMEVANMGRESSAAG